MPKGAPTTTDLWEGTVSFFSIDTDLIQSAGFRFEEGALNQLPKQLPPTMHLQLSEIVSTEVLNHRMQPVFEATQQFRSASEKLKRSARTQMADIDVIFQRLDVERSAQEKFSNELRAYVERCRGSILPIPDGDFAKRLFAMYFDTRAPFESRKDKKNEFPDATSLLLLEDYARSKGTKGIVASRDDGWRAFAESSEYIYCVQSIDELAKLFQETGLLGDSIKEQVLGVIADPNSAMRTLLAEQLDEHVVQASWEIELYCGFAHRVDAEANDASLMAYSLVSDQTSVWVDKDDPTSWVVELTVDVTVDVSVYLRFFGWDSIDKEEYKAGSSSQRWTYQLDMPVFLTCSNVQVVSNVETWNISVEFATSNYTLDIGEVDLEADYEQD